MNVIKIIILVLISLKSYGQVNQYSKPLTMEHKTAPQIDTYVPIDRDFLQQQLANKQALYDANLKNVNNLQNWIKELYIWSDDSTFRSDLIYYNNYLSDIKSKDLTQYTNAISQVEDGIQSSIDRLKIRTNNPQTYLTLAKNAFNKKDYANAIINYTKVIQLDPANNNILGSRGLSYYYNQDYTNAISDFNNYILYHPTDEDAYFYRGLSKAGLNDHNGAISDYKKTIELEPTSSMAFNNLGWEYFELKDFNLALTYVNRAIQLDKSNSIAFDSRAEIKFHLNNYTGCIEDANSALALNPSLSNSYLLLGRANYRLNNKTKACDNWQKSGTLGNTNAYEYISKYCN